MREGERWEHGNEKDNCADKPKQDMKNRVRTRSPDRTKAGASWKKFEQKSFEQIETLMDELAGQAARDLCGWGAVK